jgi:transcriptional regulator with XRE-family HTH domain
VSPIGTSAESSAIVEAEDLDDEPRLTEWYRAVGAFISASRRQAGLSQVELAKRLGWPRAKMSNVEAGKERLNLGQFVHVTAELDLRVTIESTSAARVDGKSVGYQHTSLMMSGPASDWINFRCELCHDFIRQ